MTSGNCTMQRAESVVNNLMGPGTRPAGKVLLLLSTYSTGTPKSIPYTETTRMYYVTLYLYWACTRTCRAGNRDRQILKIEIKEEEKVDMHFNYTTNNDLVGIAVPNEWGMDNT